MLQESSTDEPQIRIFDPDPTFNDDITYTVADGVKKHGKALMLIDNHGPPTILRENVQMLQISSLQSVKKIPNVELQ